MQLLLVDVSIAIVIIFTVIDSFIISISTFTFAHVIITIIAVIAAIIIITIIVTMITITNTY